jgi:hypothetical protein
MERDTNIRILLEGTLSRNILRARKNITIPDAECLVFGKIEEALLCPGY